MINLSELTLNGIKDNIKELAFNKGLKSAIYYANEKIKIARLTILEYKSECPDIEYNEEFYMQNIYIYKYCKHFIEEATKKEFSVSNKRHH